MAATTMIEPQTLAFSFPAVKQARAPRRDSFWSQTPLALLAFGAVAAIVAVNRPAGPATPELSSSVVITPMAETGAGNRCVDCGEIQSVRLVSLHPDTAPTIKTFELRVRMDDGTTRTVRQFAPIFDVGDRVRVTRNALALRG